MTDTPHRLRSPCKRCFCLVGVIRSKNGQDVVWCANCGAYCYCAPRAETGRAVASVSKLPGIRASTRRRVLDRDVCCQVCGATRHESRLDAGHIISRADWSDWELPAHLVNDDNNLRAECAECNLGNGRRTDPSKAIEVLRRLGLDVPKPLKSPEDDAA